MSGETSGNRITAQRGPTLCCRGWRQEAILRLLENNLENAEDPGALVVYMSIAKAARDWPSYERIVEALQRLEQGETLVMQSGKPIGVFATRGNGPLVVMANGNVHGLADYGTSAGLTVIADGTAEAERRLRRVLDADTGLGILRHADAGYEAAAEAKERLGLGLPEQHT